LLPTNPTIGNLQWTNFIVHSAAITSLKSHDPRASRHFVSIWVDLKPARGEEHMTDFLVNGVMTARMVFILNTQVIRVRREGSRR